MPGARLSRRRPRPVFRAPRRRRPARPPASAAHQPIRAGRAKLRRRRDDRGGVDAEPLLEQRAVDAAEVGGRAQVAVGVELRRGPGTRRPSGRARASRSRSRSRRRRGRCRRAVLLRAAAELGPDACRTRSASPRASRSRWKASERVGGQLQVVGEVVGLVVVRVVVARAPRSRRSGSAARRRASRRAPARLVAGTSCRRVG